MNKITKKLREKQYTYWEKIKRFSKSLYYKVLRIQATPEAIARGFAVGVFTGLLPVLPIQTILAITLAILVKGSKLAAVLATWVSNPLNWVPLYILFYKVGHFILPFKDQKFTFKHVQLPELLDSGWELFATLLTGGFIVAVPTSIFSYFLCLKAVRLYHKQKLDRIRKKELKKFQHINESYTHKKEL